MTNQPLNSAITQQPPTVSVIMNCLNCSKYLREAIDSVYAQTYKDWEIIFWDNASTDNSAEIAKSYDTKLRYFRGYETISLGAARNKALEQCRNEYIAFLDCDDIWMPEKLEKQIPLFDDPEVGLIYCDAFYFNEKGDSIRLYKYKPFYTGRCFSALLTDYCLCMQTVVIRRAALNEQKIWFDTRFNWIEECDLFTRISYRWKLAMINEPLAKWRVHSNSLTWQKGIRSPDEKEMMMATYHKLFPDFASRFSKEIQIIKRKTAITRAKYLWRNNNGIWARKYLFPYIHKDKKAFIYYIMTYFPEPIFNPLIQKFMKNVIPD